MGRYYLFQLAFALVFAAARCEGSDSLDRQVYQHSSKSNGRVQGTYIIEEPIISAGNDKNFQSVVIVESGQNRQFDSSDLGELKTEEELLINRPAHKIYTVGHQLIGSQQLDKLLLGQGNSRTPALKTFDVGHKLFGNQQFEKILQVSGIKSPAQRTYEVGHKLFGDRQFGQLQTSSETELTNEYNKMASENQGSIKNAQAEEIMSDRTGSRINVEKSENHNFPESVPTVEIDAIVQQPKEETSDESLREPPQRGALKSSRENIPDHGDVEMAAPSARRLISSKAYELAPSALPLISGLPHDSAHLQILSEIPHRIYIHPPKVYPITPSPELSGPLLGGPRLVNSQAEKEIEVKKPTPNRYRPYYGRSLEQEHGAKRMQEEISPRQPDMRTFQEYYFQPMMSYPMVRPGYRGNLFPPMERKYNAYYP